MPVITVEDVVNAYQQYTGRNPTQAEINQHTGQTVPNVAQAAHDFFLGPAPQGGGEGDGGGEFDFGALFGELGGMGGPSEQELHYFDLLNKQIEEQIRVTTAENKRVDARRKAMDVAIRAKYGISLEEFEAQEATGAAITSRTQRERLDKALAGELPVDPGLERQIVEDEKSVRGKLLQQVGPGYETSTPGIQSLADFRQRAEELRSAARHDEIDRGIGPAAASAQFGLSMIGNEISPDTTSIAQGLQAGIGSRQASVQANQVRANALLGIAQLQQQDRLAQLQADIDRQKIAAAYSSSGGSRSGGGPPATYGSGAGQAAGAGAGLAFSYFDPFRN